MPMDPTLGSRLIQTIIAARSLKEQERSGALERESTRYKLDRDKESRRILQDFEKQARTPVSSTQAPVAPAMRFELTNPALGGTGPDPMAPPAPPFKAPENYVMGGGLAINSNAAKVRAAQAAKAYNESRVGDLFDANLQRLTPQMGGVSVADAARLAQAGEGGHRLLDALKNMRDVDATQRRSALSDAGQEYREMGEDRRATARLGFDERKHTDDYRVASGNLGLRKDELGLNREKFTREKTIEGVTPDDVATNAGKKKRAEEAGRIAAQTDAGVNRLQVAAARDAATLVRQLQAQGVSRANAITHAQAGLVREAMDNGLDVTGALGAFNMELEKPTGLFGGRGSVKATAPVVPVAPVAPVPAAPAPVRAPPAAPVDLNAAVSTLNEMKAELARRKGAKRGR